MKKLTTRDLRKLKGKALQMLTCYDFQTAQLLNQSELDLILVGDSLGNVVLGFDTTVPVTPAMMALFGAAVRRGAPDKFLVVDMPFGSYGTIGEALKTGRYLMQKTGAEALKLEGAYPSELEAITRMTQMGIAVMGHIGLTPQSVHQMGGYYTHGKNPARAQELLDEARRLEDAGCFSLVLECVTPEISERITQALSIPTIGIGSGEKVDGQVLVINDLFGMGAHPAPGFVKPVANLFQQRAELLKKYLQERRG